MKAQMSPSDFIRSMPDDWTTRQIWEEAQKEGIVFSPSLPGVVRSSDRKKARLAKQAKADEKAKAKRPNRSNNPGGRPHGDKTQNILKFVVAYLHKHGHGPSLPMIQKAVGLKGTSGVSSAMGRLKDRGLIDFDRGHYETLRIPPQLSAGPPPAKQLPPPAAGGFDGLIGDLRAAAQHILGTAALAGSPDVAEQAQVFTRVIELLNKPQP